MDATFLKRHKRAVLVLGIAAIAAASFAGGIYAGATGGVKNNTTAFTGGRALQPEGVDFTPVWRAWSVINEKYVSASSTDAVNDEEKVWGMIQGLANSLGDPYTVFFPPADAEIFEEDISGNFQGVGMEIGKRNGVLTIVAPLKGTPAHQAGLQSGDQILKIDDKDTAALSVDQAVKLIRGERGTDVIFTIFREDEGEPRTIVVTRDIIQIPTISTDSEEGAGLRDDGVFVIQLYNFSAISQSLFRDALRQFIESGTDKLVLDLRGNPGGYLEASVDMASWFLPVGKVVVEEDFGEGERSRYHRSRGYDVFTDKLKMAILVDKGSASASEILAGALQEHGVAVLVGEQTFGKGLVQELIEITDTTALKVTVARWLTPQGNSISDGGLSPDIVVAMTSEDVEAGRDPQLERAASYLKSL